MKKEYQKPSMLVIESKKRPRLLVGSPVKSFKASMGTDDTSDDIDFVGSDDSYDGPIR